MHRPVCITYDSTCDLTPQLLERFRIRTVPLTIQSGERVFPDDGRYTSADLYADYRSRGTLPKTAAVSPEEFKAFFAPILAEGYDIVHIDISAELSCTCQNAVLAAQELTERGEIHVVDSRQLSTGGGLLALRGAKLRDAGMAAADIAAELRRLAPHSDTSFVLDTLEYMWKGGRCSGVAALGANMLKLKPCLEMREGKLVVCKKYRGSMDKVYRQYIAERLAGKAVVADHAFITHSGEVPEETLSQLTALVRELAPSRRYSSLRRAARFPPTVARARWACCSCGRRDKNGNRVQAARACAGAVWVCVMGEEGEKTFHRSRDPSLNKV